MIRKHKSSDLEDILNVWFQSSTRAHHFLSDDFVEKVKHDIRDLYIPGSETWVFEENNDVIGFISMVGNEIGGLFVLPIHQSKGIGRNLIDFILKKYSTIEVEVFKSNNSGRAFYKKYGFTFVSEEYDEPSKNIVIRLKFQN